MGRVEITDGIYLPRPGAPHMDNLAATLILTGNRATNINLDAIAHHQRFSAGEFRARFAEIEAAWEKAQWIATQKPVEWEGDK